MSLVETNKQMRARLRQSIRKRRESLDINELYSTSKAIFDKLIAHPFMQEQRLICSYYSFNNEIDTKGINSHFIDKGHTLALPTIDFSQKSIMDFYTFDDYESLVENKYQIKEPLPFKERKIDPALIEVMFVPLLGFDIHGNRLGMGGGFYDRMLKRLSANCVLIGIAHEFQKLNYLPKERWDMPLDEVITEKEHYIFVKKY